MLLDNEDVVECGAASAAGSNRLSFLCCGSGFREALLYVCVCVFMMHRRLYVPVCMSACISIRLSVFMKT